MPEGRKLYSPLMGKYCPFIEIEGEHYINIGLDDDEDASFTFYDDGSYMEGGECMLFPSKAERDWNHWQKHLLKIGDKVKCSSTDEVGDFVTWYKGYDEKEYATVKVKGLNKSVPLDELSFYNADSIKFMDGDIIYINGFGDTYAALKKYKTLPNGDKQITVYCAINGNGPDNLEEDTLLLGNEYSVRKATKSEEYYFENSLNKHNLTWNKELNRLDNFPPHQFDDGDILIKKGGDYEFEYVVKCIFKYGYCLKDDNGNTIYLRFVDEDEYMWKYPENHNNQR
jgi:hypothetical protein